MPQKAELVQFIKQEVKNRNYTTITSFARDLGLDDVKLGKFLRGDQRFDLHYFMALVEALELDVTDLYARVYRNEKKRGLL